MSKKYESPIALSSQLCHDDCEHECEIGHCDECMAKHIEAYYLHRLYNETSKARVEVDVIAGPEGPCLSIGDDDTGVRVAGPKPWGGGTTTHKFVVEKSEIIDVLKVYTVTEDES